MLGADAFGAHPAVPSFSILLVSDEERPGTLRSVADDLYSRALDSALDDALRVLRAATGGADTPADSRRAAALAPAPASPGASNALLRAVLLEDDSTA